MTYMSVAENSFCDLDQRATSEEIAIVKACVDSIPLIGD